VTKSNIAILGFVICILAVLVTKNRVETKVNTIAYKKIELKFQNLIDEKDSLIKFYSAQQQDLVDKIILLETRNDSLTKVKQKVKVKYEKIYIDIIHSTDSQLDSIIRSNW
jgi:methionine-rich copper-binding protein CopC